MGIMCYLCRRKASKRDRISLHKFPKDPILRKKWIEVCNLLLSDNLTYIYICSLHFNPKDIDRGLEFQSRCILRPGAVPSIGVPNPICCNNENINIANGGNNNIVESNEVGMILKYENDTEMDSVVSNMNNFDDANTNSHTLNNEIAISKEENKFVQELQLPTKASNEVAFEHNNDFIKSRRLDFADATMHMHSQVDGNLGNFKESCYSTSKRRVFEPRYTSEIRTPDFEAPKRTRRVLNFVRDSDEKKSKLIKSLRNRNRKLERRIAALKKTVADLKKKETVAQETGDTLLAVMKENEVTPFEIKTKGKYTPEIRSFAMMLHFYSTKAYNYVRKKFNNKLPNPSTIRAWYRVVDGSPVFTTEALQAIKLRTEKKPVVINKQ